MDVVDKIRMYLDANKISQVELCAKTHISPAKMNLSLNHKRRLTFPEYQVICWALGVNVDVFMQPKPPDGVSA